ncbi:CRISPR-associated protein Cas5 [Candidatus Bathyarchaeota archaeon]|nr:CRISPR-associated protein Cas5 [Candidatus Bathyarchaeota archaeon]
MKGIVIEISFSEALFKVHYTKGFRQSYPIPLPTSVAGIFGALLGIKRGEVTEQFKDYLFGAKLLEYDGVCPENTTYLQYKGGRPIKGVATSIIINNPSYLIALATTDGKVEEFYNKLKNKIVYFPYGGQNDFFAKDVKLFDGVRDVNEKSTLIENYAPQDFVEKVELEKGTELQILPVRHKLSPNPNFYFIFRGKLKLKNAISSVENIGVYPLEKFYYLPIKE